MSAPPDPAPDAVAGATTGAIYDIGYRPYDGPRLGRGAAIAAIVGAGLRAVFGLGRSGRAKVIPWGAVVFAIMPAGVAVAMRVLAGDLLELYDYDNYLWGIGALLWIFVAAQAPELVVNDARHRVLALYFSRPIQWYDYVGAKVGALTLGLLVLTVAPLLVLLIGRILAEEDIVAAAGNELPSALPILGSGLLHALVLATMAIAIACLAGRRAFAAGAILAVFFIGDVMSGIFQVQGGALAAVAPFLDPLSLLDGTREFLFGGEVADSPVRDAGLPLIVYPLAVLVLLALSAAILWLRYRRAAA